MLLATKFNHMPINDDCFTNLPAQVGFIPTNCGWEMQMPKSDELSPPLQATNPQCVDYLTHEWADDIDLANSWRTVSRHRDLSVNCTRLENASWRCWAKQRNNIPTLDPAVINWHKDNDTTWLYGPLITNKPKVASAPISKSASFIHQTPACLKPALKRTSLQNLRYQPHTASVKPKLRFNTHVEQCRAIDTTNLKQKRRSSIVRIAPTTIKVEDVPYSQGHFAYHNPSQRTNDIYNTHYDDYDELSELPPPRPRCVRTVGHRGQSTLPEEPTLQLDQDLPLVQRCYQVVNTTVEVVTWCRNLLF